MPRSGRLEEGFSEKRAPSLGESGSWGSGDEILGPRSSQPQRKDRNNPVSGLAQSVCSVFDPRCRAVVLSFDLFTERVSNLITLSLISNMAGDGSVPFLSCQKLDSKPGIVPQFDLPYRIYPTAPVSVPNGFERPSQQALALTR